MKQLRGDEGKEIPVEDYLYDCTRIEPLALQEEYTRVPGDMAYWSERYSIALREFLTAKASLEKVEASLAISMREVLKEKLGKAPTEAMVDAEVLTCEEYAQARQRMIDSEVEKARLNGVLEAVRAKKDMLVSFGAHVRAEMNSDPSVRSARY